MTNPKDTETKEMAAPQKAPLSAGGTTMAIIPSDVEQTYRLATIIAKAGMAPKAYLADPKNPNSGFDENKIMVGIMHGMEVGLTPMAALQSIAVINGMPSLWGDGALAIIQASGQLEEMNEWVEGEGKDMIAHCYMKRRGRPEPIQTYFSMADAIKAGLDQKKGPWQQYRRRMLQMRARSWGMRDGFADILRGIKVREEVEDMRSMGDLAQNSDGSYSPPPRPERRDFENGAAKVERVEHSREEVETAYQRGQDAYDAGADFPTGASENSYNEAWKNGWRDRKAEVPGEAPTDTAERGDDTSDPADPFILIDATGEVLAEIADPQEFVDKVAEAYHSTFPVDQDVFADVNRSMVEAAVKDGADAGELGWGAGE